MKAFGERKPAERNGISGGGVLLCIAENQLAELERGLVWPPKVRSGPGVVDEEYLDFQDVGVRLVADVPSDVLLSLCLPFISAEVRDLLTHRRTHGGRSQIPFVVSIVPKEVENQTK